MTTSLLWPLAPPRPILAGGEVHLWECDLSNVAHDQTQSSYSLSLLSVDERARADRFHFADDRQRFVACRALLRLLVGSYLEIPPQEVGFAYRSNGKPSVHPPGTGSRDLRFNVSHSAGLALLGFAWDRELGVDLERERPLSEWEPIAERQFSAAEKATLRELSPVERFRAFFRFWTRKEALIKATGDGLSRPLDSFDVSLAPRGPARLVRKGHSDESTDWWLEDLNPASGFASALAIEGQPPKMMSWRHHGSWSK